MTEDANLPPEMRARRYLDLADDARRKAAASRGEMRKHYLKLSDQWEMLASCWTIQLQETRDLK